MATARRAARREPTRNVRTHFLRHHPRTVSWLAWAQWTACPARAGRAPTRMIASRLEGSGRHFGIGATRFELATSWTQTKADDYRSSLNLAVFRPLRQGPNRSQYRTRPVNAAT